MSTENTINQIMWGAHFFSVLNGQGENVLLVIKSLSLRDRCFVDFAYKEALCEATDNNVITEFELRTRLKVKNIWDETRDEYIDVSIKRIKELEEVFKECKKGERRYKITANLLKSHKKSLIKEIRQKSELFYVTAEQYAEEAKKRALVYSCTFDEFENKYWSSWKNFEDETDLEFIENIADSLNETTTHDAKEIRKIARSADWRYMWAAAKGNILALFGTNIGEFGLDQRNLTYWSQVYDSVYEAYERPSDEIIEDDEALDKWFDEQSKKSKKEQLEKSGKSGKIIVSDNVRRHGEVFIITNPHMTAEAPTNEEVEDLNSSFVRTFKRKEQSIIKERGLIKEQELRGRNNKIARLTIGSKDAVLGKGSLGGKSKPNIVPGGI